MASMSNASIETICSLGSDLGVSEEAIRKWRERGRVPYRWQLPLLRLASERKIPLTVEDLELSTTSVNAA